MLITLQKGSIAPLPAGDIVYLVNWFYIALLNRRHFAFCVRMNTVSRIVTFQRLINTRSRADLLGRGDFRSVRDIKISERSADEV